MKKQKFMKLSAFASEPSIENSFSSPVTHNSEISVVFGGKNVSIHGWDGSAWTTIYTWNSLDKQFTFENTYQSYFLKSLTGSEELMRVSFFSGDRYQGSTPLMAGVNRDMKLYDVDEVPVYTASDASKLLTIMSDGSLRWLGISESYIVEVIGGGGDPAPPAAPSLLSQATTFGDASYNASTDVMTFDGAGDYATFAGDWKYTDAITFGAWFKTSAAGDRRIMSSHVRSGSPVRNGFLLQVDNGRLDFFDPSFSAGNFEIAGPTGMNDGQWHHVALAWNANSNWVLYVDGQQYSTNSNGAQAPAYMDGWDLYIGANGWNGNNPYGFFDGQIGGAFVENETMTLDQIQTIYNNGPEYVEGAGSGPTGAGTFLEEQTPMNTPYDAGGVSSVDNGVLTSRVGTAFLNNADVPEIDTSATEAVFSMWYNPVSSKMGLYANSKNPTGRNFSIGQINTSRLRIFSAIGNGNNIDLATPITLNEWHHILVTVSSDIPYSSSSTKSLTLKVYLDGQEVYSKTGNSTTPVRRNNNDGNHNFGSFNYNANVSDKGEAQFDFVEWVDNVSLTDAQILAMYNGGERGFSVADGVAS